MDSTTSEHLSLQTPLSSSIYSTEVGPLVFKKIEIEDMPSIFSYLQMEEGRTCDFSYGGVLMWVDYYSYEYTIYRDTLFINGLIEGDRAVPAFSLPIGAMPLEESIPLLRDYCEKRGKQLIFSAIPEEHLDEFRALQPKEINAIPDMDDYLYDAAMLSTLKGKKMSKKRNHVNKFEATFPDAVYKRITPDDVPGILRFMDALDAEGFVSQAAADERRLTRLMLDYIASSKDSPLVGGMLINNDKILAFTVGDVKGDTLYIHIEKAERSADGAYEAINKYFAADMTAAHPEILYINREDDAGDIGLRMAKESYHPLAKLKKYNILF